MGPATGGSLVQLLSDHDINARMVGSRKDGTMSNSEHEGWRGFRIDEIEKKAKKSVQDLFPNIFLVNVGSNDCLQSFDIDRAGERMCQMIDFLWLACPQSTILLSTLLVSADKKVSSMVISVNAQIRALVETKSSERRKILLVDMYSPDGPDAQCLVDGMHPNNQGYEKMAILWLRGMQEASDGGFIDLTKYKYHVAQ